MPATTPLDPHCGQLLRQIAARAAAVPSADLSLERRRALSRESDALFSPPGIVLPVGRESLTIPLPGRSLPARLYTPPPELVPSAAREVLLVFFHGGGWVVGGLDTHDSACAFLARRIGCRILSVEYRKAPEHACPELCADAAEAFAWAAAQTARWGCTRIGVAGDSAGGHLAAHAVYANPAVDTAAALLFYPVADNDFGRASYREFETGPGLSGPAMVWYWQQLLGTAAAQVDARAVLMRQRWTRRPPPTVLSIAVHDPLRDEGVAYGALLRDAGAHVDLQLAPDMAHGFLRQCWVSAAARRHVEAAADGLLACLSRASAAVQAERAA